MNLPDLGRLGIPGVVGMALLLFCLSFYFGSFAPARDELRALGSEQARLAQLAAQASGAPLGRAPAQSARHPPPALADAPDILKQLGAAAGRHGLALDHASYRLIVAEGQRRMELTLPLKGSYPGFRAFLRDLFGLAPAASIDELKLHRAAAREAQLEADLRLSYPLAAS